MDSLALSYGFMGNQPLKGCQKWIPMGSYVRTNTIRRFRYSWTSFMRYSWGMLMLNQFQDQATGQEAVFYNDGGVVAGSASNQRTTPTI